MNQNSALNNYLDTFKKENEKYTLSIPEFNGELSQENFDDQINEETIRLKAKGSRQNIYHASTLNA